MNSQPSSQQSTASLGHVLITGSSTGIGKSAALRLAGRGFTVLAAVRRDADAQNLQREAAGLKGDIRTLLLDVTDAASIAAAAEFVRDTTGPAGLRALVNNAGICIAGPIESLSCADWHRQFDVNLFGQIDVTRAMLPLLRTWSSSHLESARIVMIGSIAGRFGQPILGAYCASKHALEAVSDALRIELRDQNIHTSLIEPGSTQSEIWGKADQSARNALADPPTQQLYGKMIETVGRMASQAAEDAIPADRVARVVEICILRRRPPTRTVVGRDSQFAALARRFLPDRWFDALVRRELGI